MNTHIMNSSRHANPKETEVWWFVALMMVVFFSSCSTTTTHETVNPAPNPHWVKVRSDPPTWYPLGTPTNCETDHRGGDWIITEDAQNTRFFIPFHGMPANHRKALINEALAARDADKLRKIDRENTVELVKGLVLVPLSPLLSFGL